MNKKISVLIISLSLVILTLVIAGCTVSQTKYVCSDGTTTDSAAGCSVLEPTERVAETIRYVCPDKSIVENADFCPEVIPVTITKYQCQDGITIVDAISKCPKIKENVPQVPATQIINGYGRSISDRFYLNKGFTIFRFEHKSGDNFIAYLIYPDGETTNIANDLEDSESSSSKTITTAGYYRIEVGPAPEGASWTITIEQ